MIKFILIFIMIFGCSTIDKKDRVVEVKDSWGNAYDCEIIGVYDTRNPLFECSIKKDRLNYICMGRPGSNVPIDMENDCRIEIK